MVLKFLQSDFAMGELVRAYPNRVVLGCLYSGVQTPYVKLAGSSAFPLCSKMAFPYLTQNWQILLITLSLRHIPHKLSGWKIYRKIRVFCFTFSCSDEIPRWVPFGFLRVLNLHNLLGGKRISFLSICLEITSFNCRFAFSKVEVFLISRRHYEESW